MSSYLTARWPPTDKAEEKGIDVALAIDFVAMAVEDKYDVGVIASCDTDLRPALEFVHRRFGETKRVEVVAGEATSLGVVVACPSKGPRSLTAIGWIAPRMKRCATA